MSSRSCKPLLCVLVYFDKRPSIVLCVENRPHHVMEAFLDEYAETCDIDRSKLTGIFIEFYDVFAEKDGFPDTRKVLY